MSDYHVPILLGQVLDFLAVGPDKKYIDCNLGGAGHTRGILERGGVVLGIDWDQEAIDYVCKNQKEFIETGKLVLRKGNFAYLKNIANDAGFGKVSGILFDLGVSSHQLDTDYRGFSFNRGGLLDMRMDKDLGVTARDLINAAGESELANIFWRFAQEKSSRRIAAAIVHYRKSKSIETTDELAKVVMSASFRSGKDRNHPATRVFQALRIAVNDELANIDAALPQALDLVEIGGRLVILSFHSGEDRIVKDFFRNQEKLGKVEILTRHVIKAGGEEIRVNPRAKSAKLRVLVKKRT